MIQPQKIGDPGTLAGCKAPSAPWSRSRCGLLGFGSTVKQIPVTHSSTNRAYWRVLMWSEWSIRLGKTNSSSFPPLRSSPNLNAAASGLQ